MEFWNNAWGLKNQELPWFLFVNHQLNACIVHALPNLAAFQRKGKVVGGVTAGSLL